jgi:hypothetical protein
MCRCHNPASHRTAYSVDAFAGYDTYGQPISWQDLMIRVLDYYGTPTVMHQEEQAAWRHVLDNEMAEKHLRHYAQLGRDIGQGMALQIDLEVQIQYHDGDRPEPAFAGWWKD